MGWTPAVPAVSRRRLAAMRGGQERPAVALAAALAVLHLLIMPSYGMEHPPGEFRCFLVPVASAGLALLLS